MILENKLSIVDTQSLSPQTIEEIDRQVDDLIECHKNNRYEINRLVFDSTVTLTAGDKLAQNMKSQGKLKRFWKRLNGDNDRTQDDINIDLVKAQYAAQQTLKILANQQLLGFELIAAVNNRLNASMLEVNAELNNIYSTLLTFFRNARAEIVQLEIRLKDVEQNVNLLNWQNSIEYQMYAGVEYQDLDDATKIVCLVKDFYEITDGTWRTTDLLLMKTAMATVGLNPRDKVSVKDFVSEVSSNVQLYVKLLGDNAQFATEEEQITFALKAAEQPADREFKDVAVSAYEFVLELLCDLRQLEYNKTIHEKLQEAKKLFLSYEIKQALPLLQETADAGKDEARYMLSIIYSKGLAGETNLAYATLLTQGTILDDNPDILKKRADSGDVFAQYEMAQYHWKAAMNYLEQSANQDYFLAKNAYSWMYNFDLAIKGIYNPFESYHNIASEYNNAIKLYEEACKTIDLDQKLHMYLKSIEYMELSTENVSYEIRKWFKYIAQNGSVREKKWAEKLSITENSAIQYLLFRDYV